MLDDSQIAAGHLNGWLEDRFAHLELDIGCNNGQFLRRVAHYHSSNRYIGIDINRTLCESATKAIETLELTNVRIVNMEAHKFVSKYVQSNLVNAVHIYFPTPYPHSIGLKRRLINRDFLEELYRILVPGGSLRVVTDHKEYFTRICDSLHYKPWWHVDWFPPLPFNISKGFVIDTPCEWRYKTKTEIFNLQVLK